MAKIDAIDSTAGAWLVIGAVFGVLMAPALVFFYRGYVGDRGAALALAAKATWIRWMIAVPILGLQWILFGYSLAFGPTRHGLIGGLAYAGLKGIGGVRGDLPSVTLGACRMMFAVIAPALVSGALGSRMKTGAFVAFVLFWSTLVYDPVAHWLWASGGWLSRLGAIDYAGGIAVHCTAGVAAFVCAVVVSKGTIDGGGRLGRDPAIALAGAAVLWLACSVSNTAFGPANGTALVHPFATTHLGAAGGALGWAVVEWLHRGRPTTIGVASGVVSGLVGAATGAGFVAPSAAMAIGFIAGAIGFGTRLGVVSALIACLLAITAAAGQVEPSVAIGIACLVGIICHAAVSLRVRFGWSRSSEPFWLQGVGGVAGALLTGVFAQKALNRSGANGALFGNSSQLAVQALACAAVALYAALATFLILKVIDVMIGLRLPDLVTPPVSEGLAANPKAARAA